MEESQKFWYCVKHDRVEGEEGCRAIHRLGPYDTYDEAANALEIAAERNEEWEQDSARNDDE